MSEKTTQNNVIDNIKKIRRSKGISQESIAYDLGIDYSTYGKIERGQISLTVDRLHKIAEILAVSINDIYGIDQTVGVDNLSLKIELKFLKEQLADRNKIIKLMESKS